MQCILIINHSYNAFDSCNPVASLSVERILQNTGGIQNTTVKSRYLELGYLELYNIRSVYLNQKYILIAFFNHNLVSETVLQVQITRSANEFALRVI